MTRFIAFYGVAGILFLGIIVMTLVVQSPAWLSG